MVRGADVSLKIWTGMSDYPYQVINISPVVGRMTPDPLGIELGTGYFNFSNAPLKIDGLCKPIPHVIAGIEFLAVVSLEPGRGHFTEFVRQLKVHYRVIRFWLDMNPALSHVMQKEGFVRVASIDSDGSKIRGWEFSRGLA